MDRRTLLALAASVSAVAATPAGACSVALNSPRSTGLENQQVRKLFQAWWERDADIFQAMFTETLMADGSAMEPKLARELHAANPIPSAAYDIFDQFFTDGRKQKKTPLIVNTKAGVIVACSEGDPTLDIQADCTGMPTLHLFLVAMTGLNPRSVTHLASVNTVETDKFSIWTDGSL